MKDGDLFIDPDGRTGVILCIVEALGIQHTVGMGFFFDTGEELIIYEEDIEIIGGYNGTYILE